tara:strand:+ start:29 stop:334 length:306 start_codon:yes stop_codon:yes gene_type:complete
VNALEKKFDAMKKYDEVIVEHVAWNGLGKVAKVLVDKSLSVKEKLDKAYMLTQNINDGWWNNELVTNISQEDALRSTSVEDIMHINGDKYMVDMVGFKKLN